MLGAVLVAFLAFYALHTIAAGIGGVVRREWVTLKSRS